MQNDSARNMQNDQDTENTENIKEIQDTGDVNGADAELKNALRERDEYIALSQRIQADFDNFRRRNASVRADACAQGCQDTLRALLPVLDNLERAVQCGESREGIEMIFRQYKDILKSMGVEEVPAEGEKFDPNLHEALMQAPPCEGRECGDVLAVILKGYSMDGKILRHAKVQVAGE